MTRLREQGELLRQANAQLTHYASTLENLTVSRERNRMARELHDTLAHTLTGLSVTLETVKAYWDVDEDKARGLLDKSLETTRTGVEETRRALKSLRASPLEDMGLTLAIQKMAELLPPAPTWTSSLRCQTRSRISPPTWNRPSTASRRKPWKSGASRQRKETQT